MRRARFTGALAVANLTAVLGGCQVRDRAREAQKRADLSRGLDALIRSA